MKNLIQVTLAVAILLPLPGFTAEMGVSLKGPDSIRPNTSVTPRVLFGPTQKLANEPLAKFFRKSLIDYFHIRYPSTVDTTNKPDHIVKIVVKSLKVEPAHEGNPANVDMKIKISVKNDKEDMGDIELQISQEVAQLDQAAFETITREAMTQIDEYLHRLGI